MEMDISPGLVYVFPLLPFLFVPPAATYGVVHLFASHTSLNVPAWLIISAILLSRPLLSYLQHLYEQHTNSLIAAANCSNSQIKVVRLSWIRAYEESGERCANELSCIMLSTVGGRVRKYIPDIFTFRCYGPLFFKQLRSLLGLGVFNSDGDLWKFHRSMSRAYFSRDRISHFDNFEKHASDALNKEEKRLGEGYAFDFQDLVARFTLDSATQFLFGYDVQSLSAGLPYPASAAQLNTEQFLNRPSNKFVNAFAEDQYKSLQRTKRGKLWTPMEFWKDEVKPFRKIVDAYTSRKEKPSNPNGDDEGSNDTLLEDLIEQTQGNWCLRFLTLSSDHQMSKYSTMSSSTSSLLDEIHPLDSRTSAKPTMFTSKAPSTKSYLIPATIKVLYSVFLMHRRTDLWGPDASQFDPGRFLDNSVKNASRISSWRLTLTREIVCKPPVHWAYGKGTQATEKIWPEANMTVTIKGGLWVTMDPVKQ
ncbi:cytochrome P450 [Crepidotus variabilis]|uniref:Cytochrome P450 n=1 Tax=Crepidotus variabilis TaxID=179855 RepID=A0A9P6E6E5_9AGAR|nr:cytochrome P450 [Crepidotus variabilis]